MNRIICNGCIFKLYLYFQICWFVFCWTTGEWDRRAEIRKLPELLQEVERKGCVTGKVELENPGARVTEKMKQEVRRDCIRLVCGEPVEKYYGNAVTKNKHPLYTMVSGQAKNLQEVPIP